MVIRGEGVILYGCYKERVILFGAFKEGESEFILILFESVSVYIGTICLKAFDMNETK